MLLDVLSTEDTEIFYKKDTQSYLEIQQPDIRNIEICETLHEIKI